MESHDLPRAATMTISATETTPFVDVDLTKGTITIKGRSSPQSNRAFYQPIIDFLASNHQVSSHLTVNFQLEYFRASTCNSLLMIFNILKEMINDGRKVEVNWIVEEEDRDLIEVGEDFHEVTGLPFNFVYFSYS